MELFKLYYELYRNLLDNIIYILENGIGYDKIAKWLDEVDKDYKENQPKENER